MSYSVGSQSVSSTPVPTQSLLHKAVVVAAPGLTHTQGQGKEEGEAEKEKEGEIVEEEKQRTVRWNHGGKGGENSTFFYSFLFLSTHSFHYFRFSPLTSTYLQLPFDHN